MTTSSPTPLNPNLKTCLSIEDTALQLGIGRTSVYALIKSGQLGSVKLGRRRVVPATAIEAMITRMQDAQAIA